MTAHTPQPAQTSDAIVDWSTLGLDPTPQQIDLFHAFQELAMDLATEPGVADELSAFFDAMGASENRKTRIYRVLWKTQQILVEDGKIPAVTLPPVPEPISTPTIASTDAPATHRTDLGVTDA